MDFHVLISFIFWIFLLQYILIVSITPLIKLFTFDDGGLKINFKNDR
jgi:hypothetical protein